MNELARLAANTVGAKEVVNIDKYADGLFNKVFVFTFEDGKQVAGKVPNPVAITPHLTTASEVATMEFMRTVLKTPTPRVYAWSSKVDDSRNSVGVEFIIMEKIAGVPLGENIYVNPENPTEITGIIDWQSTPITPLFDQPLDLPFVKYDGPDIGGNLEIPMLPDDFQSMQDDEKKKVHKDYMDKSAVVAWRLLLKHKNPTYYRAVSSKMEEDWQEYAPKGPDMNPVPCPFSFPQAKITEIHEDEEATARSTRIAAQIQEHLGPLYPYKGVIEHENYEEVKKILGEIKQEVIEHLFETTDDIQTFDNQWPYRD
ncbi:hypothetical protein H101_06405 [Trichophyton interdigitale H6]|nr:hypothetical protein H101_06405 [Trichophyton interdigitale H6]